jgi:thiamine kinase-like enzyme
MNLRPLPETAADVTPCWLNAALAQSPAWHGGPIISVTLQPIGGDDALASAVFKAHIGVQGAGDVVEHMPLLVKLHDPDAARRDDPAYAAEAYFYRKLAHRVGTPVPQTYVADCDERERRLVIVQEFLADGHIGSADTRLNVDDLDRVLATLATLHAGWWNSHELAHLEGVRAFDAVIRNAIVRLRSGALDVPRFMDRFGDTLGPTLRAYYLSMPVWMEQVADGFSGNVTLIHLDCSAKNLFIPRDRRRDPILFDWALFRSGNPALDLATLLCYSMNPSEHQLMPELVGRYHNKLTELGVGDYRYEELWRDYQLACLWRMVAPVANAAFGTAARDKLARTIIPRLESALLSCGALDQLGPL